MRVLCYFDPPFTANAHKTMLKRLFSYNLALVSLLLKSCSLPEGMKNGYHIQDGKVMLYTGFPSQKKEVGQADADSFKAINTEYGKDKNHVFLLGMIVPNADPATFVYMANTFAKDRNHGFINGKIVSNDPAHFAIVPNPNETPKNVSAEGIVYARDSRNVYTYSGDTLAQADPATFRFVPMFNGYSLAVDKHYVYFQHRPLENVDGQTFTKLSDLYFKDKASVWILSLGKEVQWITIPEADVATFKSLKKWYAKDKNHVYYENRIVEGADLVTFEEGENGEGKDKNNTYLSGEILLKQP